MKLHFLYLNTNFYLIMTSEHMRLVFNKIYGYKWKKEGLYGMWKLSISIKITWRYVNHQRVIKTLYCMLQTVTSAWRR